MVGEAIVIGPFVGGLNTYSDPTAVADNQLVRCENFELDFDGSLKSRPPIIDRSVSMPLGATGNMSLLGYFYAPGGIAYLIASDGLSSTYYYTGTSWTILTNTIAASAMCQFGGKAWLMAPVGAANPGGNWTPSGGFVADANMPKGEVLVAHKSRLWAAVGRDAVANGTTVYFSKVLGTVPLWPAVPDFVDIGSGDGQNIVQIVVYYQQILIFRTNSIYNFLYSTDPASGSVNLIAPGVGLSDKDALVPYEGFLYFMDGERGYEFYNNRATQINQQVPFAAVDRTGLYKPFAASTFGNRVIFSYYDTMFVFSLNTRTWTTWISTTHGPIGRIITLEQTSQFVSAVAHSSRVVAPGGGRTAKTLFITDGVTTEAEAFHCIAQTKNYNYEASSTKKRLFWWGADASFRSMVTALATPITFNQQVTWGTLRTTGWATVKQFTWMQPFTGTIAIQTVRSTSGTGAMRKFVKFMKSLYFRQINFKVDFDTDGSSSTAPVRLFSLVTYVSAKAVVSKTVS